MADCISEGEAEMVRNGIGIALVVVVTMCVIASLKEASAFPQGLGYSGVCLRWENDENINGPWKNGEVSWVSSEVSYEWVCKTDTGALVCNLSGGEGNKGIFSAEFPLEAGTDKEQSDVISFGCVDLPAPDGCKTGENKIPVSDTYVRFWKLFYQAVDKNNNPLMKGLVKFEWPGSLFVNEDMTGCDMDHDVEFDLVCYEEVYCKKNQPCDFPQDC